MSALLWPVRAVELVAIVVREVLKSNLAVCQTIFSPHERLHPGTVLIPLEALSDSQATALANVVTLTPGTLSVSVDRARQELLIHTIDASNPEAIRHDVKQVFERRIMRVFP